jgi:hypothetical protein
MIHLAMIALFLSSPAAYEAVPDAAACELSLETTHDLSEQMSVTSERIAFLLQQQGPGVVYVADVMVRAERLIEYGQHQLEALISHCGGGVLDWAADLRGASGDLRSVIEVGRLQLPQMRRVPSPAAGST